MKNLPCRNEKMSLCLFFRQLDLKTEFFLFMLQLTLTIMRVKNVYISVTSYFSADLKPDAKSIVVKRKLRSLLGRYRFRWKKYVIGK